MNKFKQKQENIVSGNVVSRNIVSKKIKLFMVFVTLTLLLVACDKNSNKDLEKITIVLDWAPNTNHTGLYVAQEKGYFEEVGLEVEIVQPPEDGAAVLVASGKAQFGIDFQDTMAPAFIGDEKLPITAVATIIQHNTSGIISLKEKNIDSPKMMEEKVYATWDMEVEKAMVKNIVEMDGGDFSKVELLPTYVTDVVSGLKTDVDTIWVFYGWDGIATELAQVETNFFFFKDINPVFDYYTPVIIGNNDYISKNEKATKDFLSACKKGYEFSVDNPDEAAEILVNKVPELDINLVAQSQKWLANEYINDASSWGIIDESRWDGFYLWLYENSLISEEIPKGYGFTNKYLQ